MTFKNWLQGALSQEEWPEHPGYIRRYDGDNFFPPIPIDVLLSDYALDGSQVRIQIRAKGKRSVYPLPPEVRQELDRAVRALCQRALDTDNFVSELRLYLPVPLEGETLQTVMEALKSAGYEEGRNTHQEEDPGTHIYWVNAKKNWSREYRVYMTENYEWTTEDPGPEAPGHEVMVRFEPDSGTFLDLKCGNLAAGELAELLAFVNTLRDR